jgi:hypothetical protein
VFGLRGGGRERMSRLGLLDDVRAGSRYMYCVLSRYTVKCSGFLPVLACKVMLVIGMLNNWIIITRPNHGRAIYKVERLPRNRQIALATTGTHFRSQPDVISNFTTKAHFDSRCVPRRFDSFRTPGKNFFSMGICLRQTHGPSTPRHWRGADMTAK